MSWAFGLLKNTNNTNQTFRCLRRTLIPLTAVRLSRMLLLTQDASLVVNCAKTIFHLGESRWCRVAVFWDSCPSLFTSSSRRGEASRLQREAWSLHAHTHSPSMRSVSPVSARAADRTADAQIALITVVKTNRRRACVHLWPCLCCCCAEAQRSIAGRISPKISHMYKLYLQMC